MGNVGARTRTEVVQDGHAVSASHQGVAKVRADKSGATGDEYAHTQTLLGHQPRTVRLTPGNVHLTLRKVGSATRMSQTTRQTRTAGVDWAALITGLGLGLTIALQLTTISKSDIGSFYSTINSLSRLCALVGTYFALLGILLVARIPWVERGVGHDRLVLDTIAW